MRISLPIGRIGTLTRAHARTRVGAESADTAILVALGGFLWQIANGQSGSEFGLVAAVAGVGYLIALVWLRWRD